MTNILVFRSHPGQHKAPQLLGKFLRIFKGDHSDSIRLGKLRTRCHTTTAHGTKGIKDDGLNHFPRRLSRDMTLLLLVKGVVFHLLLLLEEHRWLMGHGCEVWGGFPNASSCVSFAFYGTILHPESPARRRGVDARSTKIIKSVCAPSPTSVETTTLST